MPLNYDSDEEIYLRREKSRLAREAEVSKVMEQMRPLFDNAPNGITLKDLYETFEAQGFHHSIIQSAFLNLTNGLFLTEDRRVVSVKYQPKPVKNKAFY